MAWCEGSGASLSGNFLCSQQQCFREQLQSPGDDDWNRSCYLPNILVTLHNLLNPSLIKYQFISI